MKSGGILTALAASHRRLHTFPAPHGQKVGSDTLSALAVLLPCLSSLALDDTLTLPVGSLAALGAFSALRSLSLRYCALPAGRAARAPPAAPARGAGFGLPA